jgi:hypothetical protein
MRLAKQMRYLSKVSRKQLAIEEEKHYRPLYEMLLPEIAVAARWGRNYIEFPLNNGRETSWIQTRLRRDGFRVVPVAENQTMTTVKIFW